MLSGVNLACQSERNVRVSAYYVLACAYTGDHDPGAVFVCSSRNDVYSFGQGLVEFSGPFHLYLNHPRKTAEVSSCSMATRHGVSFLSLRHLAGAPVGYIDGIWQIPEARPLRGKRIFLRAASCDVSVSGSTHLPSPRAAVRPGQVRSRLASRRSGSTPEDRRAHRPASPIRARGCRNR